MRKIVIGYSWVEPWSFPMVEGCLKPWVDARQAKNSICAHDGETYSAKACLSHLNLLFYCPIDSLAENL
jgi:hypothetical protein